MELKYRILIFLLTAILIGGIFSQVFLKIDEHFFYAYPLVDQGFSIICHQQSDKLIEIFGVHSLVCARCTGIYLGLFFMSLLNLFINFNNIPSLKILILLSTPMFIDVLLTTSEIYDYSKSIAFFTGFLFGSVGFLYFYGGVKKLFSEIQLSR